MQICYTILCFVKNIASGTKLCSYFRDCGIVVVYNGWNALPSQVGTAPNMNLLRIILEQLVAKGLDFSKLIYCRC